MFTTNEIKCLVKENKMYKFYTSRSWRRIANQVRKEQHNECQICKANGKYIKADVIHHVKHIRDRPDLAYSKTFKDSDGTDKFQLICLCHKCHEIIHDRNFSKKIHKGFYNSEKW